MAVSNPELPHRFLTLFPVKEASQVAQYETPLPIYCSIPSAFRVLVSPEAIITDFAFNGSLLVLLQILNHSLLSLSRIPSFISISNLR